MSQIKVNEIYDASGGSTAKLYGPSMRYGGTAFVNRIINGDMRIDQRGAGASVTQNGSQQYTLDRWWTYGEVTSKFTTQQTPSATESGYAVRVAAGFRSYLAVTSSAATTVGAGDRYALAQSIEGFNVSDLAWGTTDAKPITISFLVRSSLTGTFGGAVRNSAGDRAFPFSFTVSTANTWEQKTVTVTGDTSGTWLTTNGAGIALVFGLGVGSTFSTAAGSWVAGAYWSATGATSVVGTSGATFYITGVQLEAGTVASPFERRDYGRELMMCQRYARFNTTETGASWATTVITFSVGYDIEMRSAPTVTIVNGANAMTDLGVATRTATGIPYFAATTRGAQVDISTVSTTNNKVHVLAPSVLFLNSEL